MRRDTRSQAQRNHDAFLAALQGLLASSELGQHKGLPTIVVSTTLKNEAATGKGNRWWFAGADVGPYPDGEPRAPLSGIV